MKMFRLVLAIFLFAAATPAIAQGKWNISMITGMTPGTWLAYGDPWDNLNVRGSRNFCNRKFANIMRAWTSGTLDDQGNLWIVAAGGHADGCDQSTYKYNIDDGRPEIAIDHIPHTHKKQGTDWTTRNEAGELLQPRSGHNYNGTIFIEDRIYYSGRVGFPTGQQAHADNWTIDTENPTYVRVADDVSGEANLMAYLSDVSSPGDTGFPGTVVSVRGWSFCERNLTTGKNFNCSNGKWWFDLVSGQIYGRGNTVWAHGGAKRKGRGFLKIQRIGGGWTEVAFARTRQHASGPVQVPPEWKGGKAGACIVPTQKGDIPLFMGDGADLLAWLPNGEFKVLSAPDGPGAQRGRRIYGKWGWSERLQVCIGADRTSAGLWIYKPDVAVLVAASN